MNGIGFRLPKSSFFDRPKVMKSVDRATRRVLSRFGAYVRTTAKRSIKRPRKPPRKAPRKAPRNHSQNQASSRTSQPGSAPYSHEGSLKRLIYFGFDPRKRSVVIGPVPFKEGEAPELLEEGGTAVRRDHQGKRVTARYRPRPFMGPAYHQELPSVPQMWRDSVKP